MLVFVQPDIQHGNYYPILVFIEYPIWELLLSNLGIECYGNNYPMLNIQYGNYYPILLFVEYPIWELLSNVGICRISIWELLSNFVICRISDMGITIQC